MMKKLIFAIFALFILFLIPCVTAQSFDVSIKGVPESAEPLSVMAGETISIEVTLAADEELEEVMMEAELTYSNGKIKATTTLFDILTNATHVLEGDKAIYMGIPWDLEEGTERVSINIMLTDEDGDKITVNGFEFNTTFDIVIQRENNRLEIKSVKKSDVSEAGERTLISVAVKNTGSNPQDEVYVEARIPALGIISKRLLGLISEDKDENIVEIEIPIALPEEVKTGYYAMKVRAFNDRVSVEKIDDIGVKGVNKEILLTDATPLQVIQDVEQGKRTTYEIILLNLGTSKQKYDVLVREADNWATVQVEPATVTLDKDESQIIEIFVAPQENIAGEQIFNAQIRNKGEIIKEISFVADVVEAKEEGLNPFVTSLIIFAIVAFFFVLIFMGLRMKGEYKERLKAVAAVGEAKDLGREEEREAAKQEAVEIVSSIMDKVLQTKEEYVEVARERAAGRASRVMENLAEDEIEEVFGKAVINVREKKEKEIDSQEEKEVEQKQKEKEDFRQKVKDHAHNIITKISHRLGNENDLDEVVGKVANKLSGDEITNVGVPKAIENLTKLKEKIGSEIEKLKVEEEEEVIIADIPQKAEKKAKGAKKKTVKGKKTKVKSKSKKSQSKTAKKTVKKAKPKSAKKAKPKAVKKAVKKVKPKVVKKAKPKAVKKAVKKAKPKVAKKVVKKAKPKAKPKTKPKAKPKSKSTKTITKKTEKKIEKKEGEIETPKLEKIITKEIIRKF